jgi:hypothetical protein
MGFNMQFSGVVTLCNSESVQSIEGTYHLHFHGYLSRKPAEVNDKLSSTSVIYVTAR